MFKIVRNDRQLWTSILEKFPKADVYHSYDYHSLCCAAQQAQGFQLLYFQHGDSRAAIPVLLHELTGTAQPVSDMRSVYGYPSPLFSSGWTADMLRECWAELVESMISQSMLSLSSRISPFCTDVNLLSSIGTVSTVGDIVIMPTNQDETSAPLKYRSNHRRDIRGLIKRDIQCRQVQPSQYNDVFMELYRQQMNSAGASDMYLFDQSYFDSLNATEDFDCRLYACFDGSNIICAGYFLFGKQYAHYHLGTTSPAHRQLAPSKLLFDTVYKDCIDDGIQALNLGGGVGCADDSLLKFKMGFSPERLTFKMFQAPINVELEHMATKERESKAKSEGLVLDESFVPRYRAPMKKMPGTNPHVSKNKKQNPVIASALT